MAEYLIHDWQGITNETVIVNFNTQKDNVVYVMHRAYIAQQAQFHQGTHKVKTRGEVRGGGRKPWKQKGTGRARVGSIRSPLWRGGGVIFGPTNRKYNKKINKKEKALALQGCLEKKAKNIIVTNTFGLNFPEPRTKLVLKILNNWGISNKDKILIVTKRKDTNLYLSTRNIPTIEVILIEHLNIRSLLLAKVIIIGSDTIPIIQEKYNVKKTT